MTIVLVAVLFAAAAPFVSRLGRNPARGAGLVWIAILLFGPLLVWTALAPLVDHGGRSDFPHSAAGMLVTYAAFWSATLVAAPVRKAATTLTAWRRRSP